MNDQCNSGGTDTRPADLTPVFAARFATLFAAMGDSTRLNLVHRLTSGEPRSIAQLANGLDISHQGVSKHLKVLEDAGLISAQRVGRERRYQCEPDVLHEARAFLDQVATQWDEALARLQAYVEE